MLDTGQGHLAIGTFGAGGFLDDAGYFQHATRGTHTLVGMRGGIVGMTSLTGPAVIRHDEM